MPWPGSRDRQRKRGEGILETRESILSSNSCPHCGAQNVNKQPRVRGSWHCHLNIILGRKINDFSESVAKIIAIL